MSAGDTRIRLEGVGKRYIKFDDTPTLLNSALRFRNRTRRSTLWAVRDVDLEVAEGETVGVIGRNGSGKSTMLQMLAGVTKPSEGVISVQGRVAPLISVGVGFHPELTGRENVYVNGTVLGMTRSEIDERFDSIVDFAEIATFIDTPVKFYSSGMFVRLGFAVAVAAEPDVLLIDEVLAVGDIAFQMKCFNRMRELQAMGTTVVVVSHNLGAVRNMCDRCLVLHDGEQRFLGDTNEALSLYHQLLAEAPRGGTAEDAVSPVESVSIEVLGADGQPTSHITAGDKVTFRVRGRFRRAVDNPAYGIAITHASGAMVYADSNLLQGGGPPAAAGEERSCDIHLEAALTTGTYSVGGAVLYGTASDNRLESRPHSFYVSGRHLVAGVTDLNASFDAG
jgi:ABC-2 type transport system ATP-binding protein